jgi:multicomponent Na+:H+ antiporter subunit E
MMAGTAPRGVPPGRALLGRFAAFYALWVVLIGAAFADLGAGLVAAAAATWTSLALLPPDGQRIRWLAVVAMVPAFLRKSVVAGLDVAMRALAPRVRLAPGFLAYRAGFPRGAMRNAFAMYTSLMPGTVPCADEREAIVYHCLDTSQPVAGDLAEEEQRIAGVVQEPPVG